MTYRLCACVGFSLQHEHGLAQHVRSGADPQARGGRSGHPPIHPPGRPFGLEGRNRPLEFRLLHVVEFAADGDIKRENVWIDLAAVIRQLPQD